ncbi:Putative 3-hydroxyisobutyrate dehydrogenase [Rhizopus microsporus]|nr:Putative 3-hydroxyisobutyrate dehydrogenase [Rhizopus microsporus]
MFEACQQQNHRKNAIGLIGLGQMGSGMAKNLALKATGPVYVYDLNDKAVQSLTKEYAHLKVAKDPADMAKQVSTVITMLPESSHVEKVYEAMMDYINEENILIDSSTIDSQAAKTLAEKVMQEKQALVFDAPVSGGTLGAEAGTLTFMVGAPSMESFTKIKPTLEWMGKNVVYCGSNGTGQIAKACNNMLLGISMMGVSEAMLLGTKKGMDPHLLAAIINTSTGRCWSSDTYNPYPGVIPTAPASRDYQGGFSNKLMAKDLKLAMKAAKDCDVSPPLGSMASQMYDKLAKDNEFGTLDFSSIFKFLSTHK